MKAGERVLNGSTEMLAQFHKHTGLLLLLSMHRTGACLLLLQPAHG